MSCKVVFGEALVLSFSNLRFGLWDVMSYDHEPNWWARASGKPQRYMHFEGSPEDFEVFVGTRIGVWLPRNAIVLFFEKNKTPKTPNCFISMHPCTLRRKLYLHTTISASIHSSSRHRFIHLISSHPI
jgi:hypothetical protein